MSRVSTLSVNCYQISILKEHQARPQYVSVKPSEIMFRVVKTTKVGCLCGNVCYLLGSHLGKAPRQLISVIQVRRGFDCIYLISDLNS